MHDCRLRPPTETALLFIFDFVFTSFTAGSFILFLLLSPHANFGPFFLTDECTKVDRIWTLYKFSEFRQIAAVRDDGDIKMRMSEICQNPALFGFL